MTKDLIVDNLKIGNSKFLSDSLNLLNDSLESNKGLTLRLSVRSTHSGYLLNNRVYPGYSMKDAVETWVKPYELPVLRHHDSMSDAIGRVKGAKYVQLKMGDQFSNDYQNPDTGEGLGSGFTILDMEIIDPDAITKVLDGRYSTVSTSHNSLAQICSICGTDWMGADYEECNHWPGKPFLDKKTGDTLIPFIINPIKKYAEVSFVNEPAQPNVKILGKELVKNSTEELATDFGSCMLDTVVLMDSNGYSVDLLMTEGRKDQMPNEAVFLRAKRVFSFTSKEEDMSKKTSKEADQALEKLKQGEIPKDNAEPASAEPKKEDAAPAEKAKAPAKLEDSTLEQIIEDLTAKNKDLTDKNKELQVSITNKDSVIESMKQEVTKMKSDNIKQLAKQLAMTRINLNKSGTEEINSKDKLEAYVEQLTKRTAESLQDSINDLLPELEDSVKNKTGKFINLKVENPVQGGQDNTNKDKQSGSGSELKGKSEFLKELN